MEHAEVNGLRVAFRRRGTGPTLVLLHGGLCDSRVWLRELDRFADSFSLIAWDTPGCGASSDLPEPATMASYAELLAALLDSIDVGPVHVVGHSWGSTLALQLALAQPPLVASLVLAGPYAGWGGSLPPAEVAQRLAAATALADGLPDRLDLQSMPGIVPDRLPPDQRRALLSIVADSRPPAVRSMARAMADADLRAALPRIQVPTLLIHGDEDVRSPLDVVMALHAAIPRSTLAVMPGIGHECHLEAPDVFEAIVRDFLS